MRRLTLTPLIAMACAALATAQAIPPPAFEAASIKATAGRTGIRGHSFPGNRFAATNVPLKDLILIAYGDAGQLRPDARVAGGPAWIDTDRFDVAATVGSGGTNSVAEKQRMLRSLLVDRFRLVVHNETRELPVYALRLSRTDRQLGPRLRPAGIDCEALLASEPGRRDRCLLYALPSGRLTIRGQTMSAFANALTMLLDRVVDDRTGLTGGFDADAQFNPDGLPGMAPPLPGAPPRASDEPALFPAMREQLGLTLTSTRGPVDVLVIDRAEHPTPD